jgi:hypothetical protein
MSSDQQEFAVPAQPKKEAPKFPALSYEKPPWGGIASFDYRLEVLKNGSSLETIEGPKKDVVTIGRLPICDIPMEHPVMYNVKCVYSLLTDFYCSPFHVIMLLYSLIKTAMHIFMIMTALMVRD